MGILAGAVKKVLAEEILAMIWIEIVNIFPFGHFNYGFDSQSSFYWNTQITSVQWQRIPLGSFKSSIQASFSFLQVFFILLLTVLVQLQCADKS